MDIKLLDLSDYQEKFHKALLRRKGLFTEKDLNVFRLFNGFLEGLPQLVVDKFANTLLIWDYSDLAVENQQFFEQVWQWYLERIPGIEAVVLKSKNSKMQENRNGKLVFGENIAQVIIEYGVQYALDLQKNQDASFYLDTRYLRNYLIENANGLTVLNTFAYTGSLGTAAMAGGAARVLQTDLNLTFLNQAKSSHALNGFKVNKKDFIRGDFFNIVGMLKKQETLFDCVIMDPPFFSQTKAGQIDLQLESNRLINKVRPLVKHEGRLIVVNNALFLSGNEFIDQIETLCADGYMKIDKIIPVPEDVAGYADTIVQPLPVDSSPFNHSTKIVVLQVFRKDKK